MKKLVALFVAFIGFFVGMIDAAQLPDTSQLGEKRKRESHDLSNEEFVRMNNVIASVMKRRPDLVQGFDLLQRNPDYQIYEQAVPTFQEFMEIKGEDSGKIYQKDIVDAEKTIAHFLIPSWVSKVDDQIKKYRDIDKMQDVESAYVMQHHHRFLQPKLKKVLEGNAKPFSFNYDEGDSYLHTAVKLNLPKLAQLCFDVKVGLAATNVYGQTPHNSAIHWDRKIMQQMLLAECCKRDVGFPAKMKRLREMR